MAHVWQVRCAGGCDATADTATSCYSGSGIWRARPAWKHVAAVRDPMGFIWWGISVGWCVSFPISVCFDAGMCAAHT